MNNRTRTGISGPSSEFRISWSANVTKKQAEWFREFVMRSLETIDKMAAENECERSSASSILRLEIEAFEKNRVEWLKHHAGKFAVLKGSDICGFYDSDENALVAGLEKYGDVPFLIKEVLEEDRPGR